jgi:hypothetical protein
MDEENSLLFLGDVVPYKPFRFKNTLKTVINLECPIIREGKPISGKVNLSVPENYLRQTFGENLLAVNLGNNHILDYGVEGLEATLRELGPFDYFGVNLPGNKTNNPLVITFNELRVAFYSAISEFTVPLVEFDDFIYLTILDTDTLISQIREIRNEVDRIVIYIHWGCEESSYPLKEDVITARRLVDAGADIIIGTHAHSPQPIEKYKDGIIAYNLGNFIIPAYSNLPSFYDDAGVPLSEFSKKLMLWNRISWGVAVDMKTMDFKIKKFAFAANRIIEMKTTPLDKFLSLHPDFPGDSYTVMVKKHIEKRALRRKIRNFIQNPLRRDRY